MDAVFIGFTEDWLKATFPHMTNNDHFLVVWELQSKWGEINKLRMENK